MSSIPPLLSRLALGQLVLATWLLSAPAWGDVPQAGMQSAPVEMGQTTLPGTEIHLSSREEGDLLSATVSGLLPYPYQSVAAALSQPQNWCQFMPLHFNIKACTYERDTQGALLTLYSGRKYYQPPQDGYAMAYRFATPRHDDGGLTLTLSAARGPAGTQDYLITLAATPAERGTRLQIDSSYRSSMFSTMLTSAYLNTLGRDKVGFSRSGPGEGAQLVQGLRGVVERNVMRYHLAIETFLENQGAPAEAMHEAALRHWFRLNEGYPLQLHEMEEGEYLAAKRQEWQHQHQLQQALDEGRELAKNR